jgi:hypothetical protein
MAGTQCGNLKILLDWAEKNSVLGVASLAVFLLNACAGVEVNNIASIDAAKIARARGPRVISRL